MSASGALNLSCTLVSVVGRASVILLVGVYKPEREGENRKTSEVGSSFIRRDRPSQEIRPTTFPTRRSPLATRTHSVHTTIK